MFLVVELTGQAEAVRLAISRALCEINEENPSRFLNQLDCLLVILKNGGDVKKFGQKKARKKFQFSKR